MPLEVGVGWTVTHFQLNLGLAHIDTYLGFSTIFFHFRKKLILHRWVVFWLSGSEIWDRKKQELSQ